MPDTLSLADDLLAREAALRAGGATLRMRDAATALGVPEAALLEARRATGAARRLGRPDAAEGFGALLARLPEAGEVMALTRNAACVHEVHGRFNPPDFEGAMGQVVGEIDLRLFLRHWAFGYALDEDTRSGPRRSLQFFDASGTAVHKIYPTAATDRAAFDRIADDAADPDAAPALSPRAAAAAERPDAEIDIAGLSPPGRGKGTPTSSSCCSAASASPARRRCGSPARLARPVRAGAAARVLTRAAAARCRS